MLSGIRSSFATFSPSFVRTDRAAPTKISSLSVPPNSTFTSDVTVPSTLPTTSKRPRSHSDLSDGEGAYSEEASEVFLNQRKTKKVKQYRRSSTKETIPAKQTAIERKSQFEAEIPAAEKPTTELNENVISTENELVEVSAAPFSGYIYEDQWEIKCVLATRLRSRKGRKMKQYKVDWVGVNPKTKKPWPPTWLPAHDVNKDAIKEYENRDIHDP